VANATAEDLGDLSREELDERAIEAGVEDPEDLPNKQAVIDAINEAEGTDVADLPKDKLEGETDPVLPLDARVILGESEDVPEELWGHPALVISVKEEEDEEPVYEVRTRDEHNATLFLEKEDFSQTYPGNVGVRGFGA
jgi:hypothetical protein